MVLKVLVEQGVIEEADGAGRAQEAARGRRAQHGRLLPRLSRTSSVARYVATIAMKISPKRDCASTRVSIRAAPARRRARVGAGTDAARQGPRRAGKEESRQERQQVRHCRPQSSITGASERRGHRADRGRQTGYNGFDRALDATRPMGSLVKPFVYLGGTGDQEIHGRHHHPGRADRRAPRRMASTGSRRISRVRSMGPCRCARAVRVAESGHGGVGSRRRIAQRDQDPDALRPDRANRSRCRR